MLLRAKWLISILAFASVLPIGLLNAQPAQSVVQDVIYNSDGSRFSGTAFISWNAFVSGDGVSIGANTIETQVANGVLYTQIVPTTDVSGAYYRVVYKANGTSIFREYWNVPPSSQPLKLASIRIDAPPQGATSSGGTAPPAVNTQVTIDDVANLRQELNTRPILQQSSVRGRTAFLNLQGALETVVGDEADCVRVDGSASPCGGLGGGTNVTFVDSEVPGGTVNGSNSQFSLASAPSPTSSVRIYRNGLLQRLNSDYTLSGTTITFLAGATPQAGDLLAVNYRR